LQYSYIMEKVGSDQISAQKNVLFNGKGNI
jgi:hypothetical protein